MRRHTDAKARDLKPCPFCGAVAAVDRDKYGIVSSVDCSAICDLQHPASVDWNSRPIEDALHTRAEAAEQRAEAAEAALAAAHAEVAQARVDRAVLIGAFLSSLSPAVALDVLSGVGAPHNAAEALSIFSRNGLLPIEGEKKGPELLSYLRKMLARVFAEIKAGSTQ